MQNYDKLSEFNPNIDKEFSNDVSNLKTEIYGALKGKNLSDFILGR